MTLGELLTTLRYDILHDRSDQVAGDTDQLWSDTRLISYINEAQRRFSRRSLCVRDGSGPLSRFVSTPLKKEYQLDSSVVAVMSIRDQGNGAWLNGVYTAGTVDWTQDPPVVTASGVDPVEAQPGDLARGGHSQFDVFAIPSRQVFDVNNLGRQSPGRPLAFDTDEFTGKSSAGSVGSVTVRLYPIPSVQYAGLTYQMRVCRTAAKLVGLNDVPEVPEDYHYELLDYAAYMALRIVDHEMGDPQRAGEFLAAFEAHVAEARVEMLRKQFSPMVWGFGRNGYGYVAN